MTGKAGGPLRASREPAKRSRRETARALADPFAHPTTLALVRAALAEDVGHGDVTTQATVPPGASGKALLVAREAAVVAGLPLVALVYGEVGGKEVSVPEVRLFAADGDRIARGAPLAEIAGPMATILTGERVMLNLVQHLSAVATLTRRFVDAVAGTGAEITDTRKTMPGLRLLEKYAVRVGGGRNHRFGLDDGVLIKDNHIALSGGVARAIERARAGAPHTLRVEVECDTVAQVNEALAARADVILLDNMEPEEVAAACRAIAGRALVEVSGGVKLDNVRRFAESGAELISVGAITHSAPAIDLGLDIAV
jgi:nicotinate-nucleotide pyrophosphorylase (carboxylating)